MDSLERLLKDLLEYAKEGLSIDEAMANRIRFFLEMEQQTLKGGEKERNCCPECGGIADNGFDREYPPNPYVCTKCEQE